MRSMTAEIAPPNYDEIEISVEGMNYGDLKEAGIAGRRPGLKHKIDKLHFPPGIKVGEASVWWPNNWVQAWLRWRSECDHKPYVGKPRGRPSKARHIQEGSTSEG